MERRKADKGVLSLIMESDWHVAAVASGVVLVGGLIVLPMLARGSTLLRGLAGSLQSLVWGIGIGLGVLALGKYIVARVQSRRRLDEYLAEQDLKLHIGRIVDSARQLNPADDEDDEEPVAQTDEDVPKTQPVNAWSLDVLRAIEWKGFEDLCADLYRELGIRCATTSLGADGGVDIRLYEDPDDPQRCTAISQCKAWGARDVGVAPVRELRGAMAHEKIEQGFFMAPGGYTPDARAFAQQNPIKLLDGPLILAMIERLPAARQMRLLAKATSGDWTTPTCPHCGVKMLKREGQGYRFWGCRNYPRCKQRINVRADA